MEACRPLRRRDGRGVPGGAGSTGQRVVGVGSRPGGLGGPQLGVADDPLAAVLARQHSFGHVFEGTAVALPDASAVRLTAARAPDGAMDALIDAANASGTEASARAAV